MCAGQDGWMSSTRLEVIMPRMHNLQSKRGRVEVEGGGRRGDREGGWAGSGGEREIENWSPPPVREERETN